MESDHLEIQSFEDKSDTYQGQKMRQLWEHKTIKVNTKGFNGGILDIDIFDEELNVLGSEGWELVTALNTNQSSGSSREVIAIFKRPRDS
jgi:Domain of unknown function (DUF4177)